MIKKVLVSALLCIVSMGAFAEVAKYCMSYEDFVAGNWKSVDELTAGRTQQVCQMKTGDHCVYFKTGDKESDQVLKKEAFAVMYGKQLFVNCRNLRYNDVGLETSKYVQAVRYGKNKLCIMSYRTDGLTALASLGTLVAGIVVDDKVLGLGLLGASIGCDIANNKLSDLACFLVDSGANEKGKTAITRINDDYMEKLLANDSKLLNRYKAVNTKHSRQSAANILPILMEKGLVETVAN